jgi:hypothetical protein
MFTLLHARAHLQLHVAMHAAVAVVLAHYAPPKSNCLPSSSVLRAVLRRGKSAQIPRHVLSLDGANRGSPSCAYGHIYVQLHHVRGRTAEKHTA